MTNNRSQTLAESSLRSSLFAAIFAAVTALQGCTFTVPASPNDETQVDTTKVERATAAEIWRALASATDARTVESTTRLAQLVAVLARNGELNKDDVAAFDLAFPNIVQNARPLTKADTEVLLKLASRTR